METSFAKSMGRHELDSKRRRPLHLEAFHISEDYGFILRDPLSELPNFYAPWMDIATNLSYLIEHHQLRSKIDQMPLLTIHKLIGHRQLRLAHLAMSSMTMGYVWQEGEENTAKVLPRNLAIPYCEVSQILGLPPILVHADLALANWKKKNPLGFLSEVGNLEPIISLPGGESVKGFILVTILVEKAAAPGITAVAQAVNAILEHNDESLIDALQQITSSMAKMKDVLKKMHDYVDPAIFYSVIRIFLSGWKDNPLLPDGLIYEGVFEEPRSYSGGSAAQSTVFNAFDALLGVRHTSESGTFLHRMRDYMPPYHKAFLEEVQAIPPLQQYILSSGNSKLLTAYNNCAGALIELRNYHITIVSKYVSIAGAKAKAKRDQANSNGPHLARSPSFLEEMGTGGTNVISFLKNVRDGTKKVTLSAENHCIENNTQIH
ncbi:indoleamine 2,3-dioxygenase 2 [Ambystoma mexicanum]|uniref:indoleamine 2,3-dioxygenase 2 n=1 Tax=Ambystoma mexicanum TaxID=8296 RepID=UPI0037E76BD0